MKTYTFASNIGNISLVEDNNYIVEIILNSNLDLNDEQNLILLECEQQINEYLDGVRVNFDLPYLIQGTEFEQSILKQMKLIPYGTKTSYSELAKNAGYPGASRACGTVCRKNKLPLIFPCHRVIKMDGSLGNFNSGIKLKKKLLTIENDKIV